MQPFSEQALVGRNAQLLLVSDRLDGQPEDGARNCEADDDPIDGYCSEACSAGEGDCGSDGQHNWRSQESHAFPFRQQPMHTVCKKRGKKAARKNVAMKELAGEVKLSGRALLCVRILGRQLRLEGAPRCGSTPLLVWGLR